MTLRAVIADDEPLVRTGLRRALAAVAPDIEVVGEARHGQEALELVARLTPHLLFLDVQMPEMDGLEAARILAAEGRPGIVFVTAYDHYALQAFEVHAIDYLLKPFDDERLATALARARQRLSDEGSEAATARLLRLLATLQPDAAELTHFLAKIGSRTVLVPVDRVDWIEAADNYVRLHTPDGLHVVREALKSLEERLMHRGFIRIHRSVLVNVERVRELRTLPSGDSTVLLMSGEELPLSRRYREGFEARVGGKR